MRQSQQKNRMRGRGRKQPNPLSRNYESNGPDVKIRGNAAHIAEKYMSLSRDAASAGDPVMAENYLQHAEHYNRIIAAANQQRADEQQAAGRGPQPDVGQGERGGDDPSSGNGASKGAEASQGEQQGGDTGDGGRSQDRRPRRNNNRRRQPTASAGSDEAAPNTNGGGVNGSTAPHGDSAEDKGAGADKDAGEIKDGISSDAAKLPGSLVGLAGDSSSGGASED